MDREIMKLQDSSAKNLLYFFSKNNFINLPDVIPYNENLESEMKILGYTAVREWENVYKNGEEYSSCFIKDIDPRDIKIKNNDKTKIIEEIINIIKKNKRMYKNTEKKITSELNKYDYSTIYSVKTSVEARKDFSENTFDMVKNIAKIKNNERYNNNNKKETVGIVSGIINSITK